MRHLREMARSSLLGGLALASFLLTATGVRTLIPWPRFEATARLEYLERRAEPFDVLFLGNSRVHYGVVPQVFDERLRQHGLTLSSYNLGAAGMGPWEADHVLQRVLRGPARPRYVLLQVGHFGPGIEDKMRRTHRLTYWHTLANTYAASRAALRSARRSTAERYGLVAEHVGYFFRWCSSYGLALETLERRFAPAAVGRPLTLLAPTEGGFEALEDRPYLHAGRRRRFLANLDEFRDRMARERERQPIHLNPEILQRQIERSAAAGVVPIYFREPRWGEGDPAAGLVADGTLPGLIDVDDRERYPSLFRVDRHFDRGHLNRLGAGEFSTALADAFVEQIAAP